MSGRDGSGPGAVALAKLRAARDANPKVLTSSGFALVVAIVLRENKDTGSTWAKLSTLAEDSKVKLRTVKMNLAKLVSLGVILRQRRKNTSSLLSVNLRSLLQHAMVRGTEKEKGQELHVLNSENGQQLQAESADNARLGVQQLHLNSQRLLPNQSPLPPAAGTAVEDPDTQERRISLLVGKAVELARRNDYEHPGGMADWKEDLKRWASVAVPDYAAVSIELALHGAEKKLSGEK